MSSGTVEPSLESGCTSDRTVEPSLESGCTSDRTVELRRALMCESAGAIVLRRALAWVSGALAVYLALVLALRWFVSGHAPFAGTYCIMMLTAFLSALAATVLSGRVPVIQAPGFLICGFAMLMASLSSSRPQITHLVPVLNSPLLSVHVLCMMMAYTLLALVALNGILGLCVRDSRTCSRLRDVSVAILYPALFLLIGGTMLGSLWANVSWGNYWSWDPKETSALVTILLYALALHAPLLSSFPSGVLSKLSFRPAGSPSGSFSELPSRPAGSPSGAISETSFRPVGSPSGAISEASFRPAGSPSGVISEASFRPAGSPSGSLSELPSRPAGDRAFHLYTALAFLSVLFTWLGVGILLGGLHAYA